MADMLSDGIAQFPAQSRRWISTGPESTRIQTHGSITRSGRSRRPARWSVEPRGPG
jgi:hypothetical protein